RDACKVGHGAGFCVVDRCRLSCGCNHQLRGRRRHLLHRSPSTDEQNGDRGGYPRTAYRPLPESKDLLRQHGSADERQRHDQYVDYVCGGHGSRSSLSVMRRCIRSSSALLMRRSETSCANMRSAEPSKIDSLIRASALFPARRASMVGKYLCARPSGSCRTQFFSSSVRSAESTELYASESLSSART